MTRLLLVLGFAAVVAAAPTFAGEIQWTRTYDMDREPPGGGWFGADTRHEVKDGVLHVIDPSSASGSGHCFQIEWEADPAGETIAEARVKVLRAQGEAGVCLWVSDGVNEEGVDLRADRVRLAFAGLEYPLDTTADFHVYRVVLHSPDLQIYVDDKLALDATGKFTHPAHQGRNRLTFGSASSSAQGESLWDYVRFRSALQEEPVRKPPGLEQVTIFREPETYSVFPGLRYDPATEKLSVSFRAGGRRSHIDPKGSRTVSMVSDDGGKTWHEGPMLPGKPFTGPNGLQIGVACKWWQEHPDTEREKLKQQRYLVQDVRPGVVAICAGAYVTRSTDDGKTWQRQDLDLPFMACLASGQNSLQLANGTILFPVYGSQKVGASDSSWLLRSPDYGATWQLVPVGVKPGLHLNEPEIIEAAPGKLLMVMRTGVGADHLWQAESTDDGATWHNLHDTGLKGHPPDLLRLQDGRLLLSYGYRHEPYGIRAAVSSDQGATWDREQIWTLRDDGGGFDLGYPHSVQLRDGTVVTVYYFVEPGGMEYIACTRWRVP